MMGWDVGLSFENKKEGMKDIIKQFLQQLLPQLDRMKGGLTERAQQVVSMNFNIV